MARAGAGAGARARGPSFRFSQLFPWPAAGRERKGGEVAGEDSTEATVENFKADPICTLVGIGNVAICAQVYIAHHGRDKHPVVCTQSKSFVAKT